MRGHITDHAATMAEVLRDEGYATFAVGKWHLCPMEEASAAGPFDQWPLQRGFDRFYGFLDGETDQFTPDLTYDNHRVDPPRTPEEGYHLTEDLVDRALGFIHDSVSIRPDRPFFTLPRPRRHPRAAPGAGRVPGEVTAGRYDDGWDVARERWFARQQAARRDRPTAPSWRRATPASSRGTSCPRRNDASPPASRRRSPRSSSTPTTRSAGSSTASTRMGQLDDTVHRSARPTTAPARRAARSASCTR